MTVLISCCDFFSLLFSLFSFFVCLSPPSPFLFLSLFLFLCFYLITFFFTIILELPVFFYVISISLSILISLIFLIFPMLSSSISALFPLICPFSCFFPPSLSFLLAYLLIWLSLLPFIPTHFHNLEIWLLSSFFILVYINIHLWFAFLLRLFVSSFTNFN